MSGSKSKESCLIVPSWSPRSAIKLNFIIMSLLKTNQLLRCLLLSICIFLIKLSTRHYVHTNMYMFQTSKNHCMSAKLQSCFILFLVQNLFFINYIEKNPVK